MAEIRGAIPHSYQAAERVCARDAPARVDAGDRTAIDPADKSACLRGTVDVTPSVGVVDVSDQVTHQSADLGRTVDRIGGETPVDA